MSPRRRLVLGVILSAVWAAAFLIGVARDQLYPILGVVAGVVVVVVAVVAPELRGRRELPAVLRDIALGAAVGAASVGATHLGFRIVGPHLPRLFEDVERLHRVAGVTASRLLVVILIAVAEELLWRGLVLDALRQSGLRFSVAVPGAAALYALSQVGPGSPWLLVAALAFGIVWGGLRWWSGGLWMPVVAHGVWTLSILGLVPLR